MKKIGLVLEGGAMRGMYTAGVLDVLMDYKIEVDGIIGVSAGALFGANYFSNQPGRVIRYSKRFAKDLRYISILSLLLTGNVVNKNFAYYKMNKKLDKFDEETFEKNNKDFYAVATNIKTGKPKYFKVKNCMEEMEKLRASSAMPLFTKPVGIDNNEYLDGAISDSIPVLKFKELGYDKIIVVLTRPISYKKEELTNKQLNRINKKYKKYPKLIESMINRPSNYNNTLEKIKELEKNKEIFVIRPSDNIIIKVIERNKDNLQSVYDLGIKDARDLINDLKKYINKK